MKFSAGDEVIVRGTNLVGKVIKQRLDDDIYLVRIEKFYRGDSLQSMKETEAELKSNQTLPLWSPEFAAEWERLAQLTDEHQRQGDPDRLSEPMMESLRKLGLLKKF
jgi:dihydrofolate reductase